MVALGLVDQCSDGNSAKLSDSELEHLQMQLHQYKPNQLFAPGEFTATASFGR